MKRLVQILIAILLLIGVAVGFYFYFNGDSGDNDKIGISGVVTDMAISGNGGSMTVEGK